MAAYFNQLSKQIVYLSRSGIVADGSTDNSTRLQAMLDLASTGAPLVLVNDMPGSVVCDGLAVWSNTTIASLAGSSWKKKGYGGTVAGLGKPMFKNKHPTPGTSAPTDQNIHFIGGYWDGNRRGFSSGGTSAYWASHALADARYAAFANNSDEVVPMLGFYGVTNASVRNIDMYDLACYGVHTSNVNHAEFTNLTKAMPSTDTFAGDNGVQMEGYCTNILVDGISGVSNDDMVALNPNDGNDIYPGGSPVTFPSYIASGPCSDITIRRVVCADGGGHTGTLVRILCANNSVRRLLIDDCKSNATNLNEGVYFDNFSVSGSSTHDDITIRNIRGKMPAQGMVRFGNFNATFNRLTLEDIHGDGSGGVPLVRMQSGTVNTMTLSNMTSTSCPYVMDVQGGHINDVHLGAWSAQGLTTAGTPVNGLGNITTKRGF